MAAKRLDRMEIRIVTNNVLVSLINKKIRCNADAKGAELKVDLRSAVGRGSQTIWLSPRGQWTHAKITKRIGPKMGSKLELAENPR